MKAFFYESLIAILAPSGEIRWYSSKGDMVSHWSRYIPHSPRIRSTYLSKPIPVLRAILLGGRVES